MWSFFTWSETDDSDMKHVYNLMMDYWELDKPSLVISIIGKAESFSLEGKAKEIFNRDLMAVC